MNRTQNPNIELGLSILCILMKEGDTMTYRDIGDVCECSYQTIHNIERQAMQKVKHKIELLGVEL